MDLKVIRDFSLTPRKENQREMKTIEPPVQFSLDDVNPIHEIAEEKG